MSVDVDLMIIFASQWHVVCCLQSWLFTANLILDGILRSSSLFVFVGRYQQTIWLIETYNSITMSKELVPRMLRCGDTTPTSCDSQKCRHDFHSAS